MTDKGLPTGWVVQATTSPLLLDHPLSFQYFNVAVADPVKGTEAIAKYLAKTGGDVKILEVRLVRKLSSAEIDALGLTREEAKPA